LLAKSARDPRETTDTSGATIVPEVAADTVVRVAGLGASFGGVAALDGVSATIGKGETVAVVGPNGAGKTTFLNALTGFLRDSLVGSISLSGTDSTKLRPYDIARLGVGRSFQDPRLIDEESALENILCGAHVLTQTGPFGQIFRPLRSHREEKTLLAKASRILDTLDLHDISALRVADLSYGHRKLIDIGRAMMADPTLLLLDEPSSGLDEHEQASLTKILKRLQQVDGLLTMVIVEHHMPLVSNVASRVIAMQAGRVLLDGTPQQVMSSPVFKAALVGRSLDADADADADDTVEDEI
jgi:ABC-type branched-subunit amino acid transport system ATPase component